MRQPPKFRCLAASLAAFVASSDAYAAEYRRAELIERSPFTKSAAIEATAGPYELRGFFGPGGATEASIHKTGTNECRWIAIGKPEHGWLLESADRDAGTVVLAVDGMRLNLKLMRGVADGGNPDEYSDGELKKSPLQPYAMAVAADRDAQTVRAKEDALNALRAEHPEYFKDANLMSEEERRISGNAFREIDRRISAFSSSPPDA